MISDISKDQPSLYDPIMDNIITLHFNELSAVLDHDISDTSWDKLFLQLEVIRLFETVVQHIPQKLKQEYWDVILIFLTKWQQLYNNAKHNYSDIKITMLIIAFSQLYYAVETLMNKHKLKPIPELPSTLLDEWKNVIAGNIYNGIVQTWIFYADLCNQSTDIITSIIPLNYLGEAICAFDSSILFKNYYEQTETIDFNKMLMLSLKLLQSPVPSIQLGAYYALKYMVPELVQQDKVLVESDNFEANNLNIKKFEEVLSNIQSIINTMLMEFK